MVWTPAYPECVKVNLLGGEYEDITCVYPWMRKYLLSSFELSEGYPFERTTWFFLQKNQFFPYVIVTLYMILIFSGKAYFANKKPWSLRNTLALWNLSLSIFSWIGASRTGLQAYHNMTSYSLRENFCNDPEHICGSGVTGRWIFYFVLSKFPELLDTFFIVVHKKPLIFLHWYHHVTVLLYCWHAYIARAPPGLYFASMNFLVHAIMYGYYFLMAMKMKPKWMNAIFITILQIIQMVFGVTLTVMTVYYRMTDNNNRDDPCRVSNANMMAAVIMYGSYLILFLQFFLGRYFKTSLTIDIVPKTMFKKD